jgi:hypothetical protein
MCAFSLTSSASRAACHSSGETISGRVAVIGRPFLG